MAAMEDYPVTIERTLSWGQMDAFQHVNNVEYFRFFEDARIAYFEEMGIVGAADPETGAAGPILAETSCQFLAPLTYPDDVVVGATVPEVGEDRFTLEYGVVSRQLDRLVARGDSVVVAYDYDEGVKVEVPSDWREAVEGIESVG